MKKREEREIKFYEAIGIKKLSNFARKIDKKFESIIDSFVPEKKRKARIIKRREEEFDSSKKMEDVIKIKENIPSAILSLSLLNVLALFSGITSTSVLGPIFFVESGIIVSVILSERYSFLRAKKMTEKWQTKYENQKEDTLNDIMTVSREMGHPQVEIATKNNKVSPSSFSKITKNAELSELKRYRNFIMAYKNAQENNETLPTLEYDKKKGKTLRLVPKYTKENR